MYWQHRGMETYRFTPTAVGTIVTKRRPKGGITVHPHGCGDYVRTVFGADEAGRFTPTAVRTIRR
ncbi:MAG: hypothetical protein ACYC27_10290 [Armatimonadota bacterium]